MGVWLARQCMEAASNDKNNKLTHFNYVFYSYFDPSMLHVSCFLLSFFLVYFYTHFCEHGKFSYRKNHSLTEKSLGSYRKNTGVYCKNHYKTKNYNLIEIKKNEKQNKLPEPGIDPGSLEPQSNILPLNYSGFFFYFFFL